MCKYCQDGVALAIGKSDKPNNDDYGISIQYPNFLNAYGYDIHGVGSNGITVKINYCPMCGRELKTND